MLLRPFIRQPNRVLSIGIHDEDFKAVANSGGNERNLRPVGRPIRIEVIRWMVCQSYLISSIGKHYIDFIGAISHGGKDNLTCVEGESASQPHPPARQTT